MDKNEIVKEFIDLELKKAQVELQKKFNDKLKSLDVFDLAINVRFELHDEDDCYKRELEVCLEWIEDEDDDEQEQESNITVRPTEIEDELVKESDNHVIKMSDADRQKIVDQIEDLVNDIKRFNSSISIKSSPFSKLQHLFELKKRGISKNPEYDQYRKKFNAFVDYNNQAEKFLGEDLKKLFLFKSGEHVDRIDVILEKIYKNLEIYKRIHSDMQDFYDEITGSIKNKKEKVNEDTIKVIDFINLYL